ncbi:MAG: glycosyltransferase family 87 protein [Acidimicrobiia bacterium]
MTSATLATVRLLRLHLLPLAVVLASLAVFGSFLWREVPKSHDGTAPEDFPNYYFAGRRVLEGRPVYGEIGDEVQRALGWEGYRAYPADPPATVVLLAPLSLLPYRLAWWSLALVSVTLIAGVTALTAREVGFSWWVAAAVGALALASNPARFLLARNHMESLILLAGFLGWLAWRRGRDRRLGAWWGMAAALKLFPAMWLVGLAGARPRALAWGIVTATSATLIGAAVVGLDGVATFIGEVIPQSRRWYGTAGNYSFLSVGTALGGPWLGWMLAAAGALWLVPAYLRKAHGSDLVWVAGTAAALLLSPLSWLNYLVLAFPGLVILARHLDLGRPSERWMLAGLALGLAWWPETVRLGALVPTVLASSLPTAALVAMFWLAVHHLPQVQD